MSDIEVVKSDDEKHLDLLAIFYYVFAGLTALGSCFGLFYVGLGIMFLLNPQGFQDGGQPLPAEMGYIFAGIGIVITLLALGWAAALAYTGRYLNRRVNRTFCIVIAAICCLSVPLGTILGIFTIVVLQRDSVKALFESRTTAESL